MTSAVEFQNVSRHFGPVKAVDAVDLTIAEGSFFAMLGPSGSGKTTCLRLISGFEKPTGGQIRIFGEDVSNTPPHLRNVNMKLNARNRTQAVAIGRRLRLIR